MLRYIQETPAQVRANIAASARLTQRMVELYLSRPYRTVWLVACGSSCNAGHCARYYMKQCSCTVEKHKTWIASPATIPKSGERNRKIYSCMLYLISI